MDSERPRDDATTSGIHDQSSDVESKGAVVAVVEYATVQPRKHSDNLSEISPTATDDEQQDHPHMLLNLLLLSLCWSFGNAGTFVHISTSGLVARELGESMLATLPLGLLLGMGALSTLLISEAVYHYGHKTVYVGCAVMSSAFAAATAILLEWNPGNSLTFVLFICFSIPQGTVFACTNQLRFSVVHFVTPSSAPMAVSLVIAGGMLSIVLGPEISKTVETMLEVRYAGNFALASLLYGLQAAALYAIDFPPAATTWRVDSERSDSWMTQIREMLLLLERPPLTVTVFYEVVAYYVMGTFMAATILAMKDKDYDFRTTTTAVELHMLGMYAPSLCSAWLIGRMGELPVIVVGFAILVGGSASYCVESTVSVYWISISLVGVGWHFVFVSATAVLNSQVSGATRSRLLAWNDVLVIGSLSVAMTTTASIYESIDDWTLFALIHGGVVAVLGLVPSSIAWVRELLTGRKWLPKLPSRTPSPQVFQGDDIEMDSRLGMPTEQ